METYKEFIQNILDTRGRFECGDEYHERHHIVPKCLGGGNEEENLIDLFAREHFIAHKLLAQENPDNRSLAYAWAMMAFPTNNRYQNRYELSPEEYEEARKSVVGMPKSEEHRRKIGEGNRGKVYSEETIQKMREARRNISDETRQKMSASAKARFAIPENRTMLGKHHSEESKKKMSDSTKGLYAGEKNPMYGRTWWDENTPREKIDEWKHNISLRTSGENNPNFGNHWSDEMKIKIRDGISHTKIVLQFNNNEEIINEYPSIRQMQKETGFDRSGVSKCCSYKQLTCGGFFWMFKSEYKKYGKLIHKNNKGE